MKHFLFQLDQFRDCHFQCFSNFFHYYDARYHQNFHFDESENVHDHENQMNQKYLLRTII